jgi:hypothetical protein
MHQPSVAEIEEPVPNTAEAPATHGGRSLLEVLPLPVLVVDGDGGTVDANSSLRRLVGLDDPHGRPARFLSRSSGWQRLWTKLSSAPPDDLVAFSLVDAEGRRRHFEAHVAPGVTVRDPSGAAMLATVVTLADVTSLRSLYQKLAAQRRLLVSAKLQLQAARDELRRAEDLVASLVCELEAASSPDRCG